MAAKTAAKTDGLPSEFNHTKLQNLYEELDLWEVLEVEEPWIERDLDKPPLERHRIMLKLREEGLVEVVGERKIVTYEADSSTGRVDEYRVLPCVRYFLEEYQENADRFSDYIDGACNHRVHVNNSPGDGLGCKYCDSARNYDRDAVRRGL